MIYNLTQFGDIFKVLRKGKGYSYNSLSEEAGIAKNTLRNIERGKVTPTIDTLSILSNYLNVDLTSLFLTCKEDNHQKYDSIRNQFEKMISNHRTDFLIQYMQELESLIQESHCLPNDDQLSNKLLQLYYRMIGHYETYLKKDDKAALKAYLTALRITIPNFELNCYKKYIYCYDDLHILFNIVQMNHRQDHSAIHLTMYHFIYDYYAQLIEKEIYLFPTLVNNIAVTHLNNGSYEQALKFANIGLSFINQQQTTIDMPALMLCKGIVLHHLKMPYAEFFMDLSFNFLVLANRADIIDMALRDLKNIHKIDYKLKTEPVRS